MQTPKEVHRLFEELETEGCAALLAGFILCFALRLTGRN
jgi:hypothetical protein